MNTHSSDPRTLNLMRNITKTLSRISVEYLSDLQSESFAEHLEMTMQSVAVGRWRSIRPEVAAPVLSPKQLGGSAGAANDQNLIIRCFFETLSEHLPAPKRSAYFVRVEAAIHKACRETFP